MYNLAISSHSDPIKCYFLKTSHGLASGASEFSYMIGQSELSTTLDYHSKTKPKQCAVFETSIYGTKS